MTRALMMVLLLPACSKSHDVATDGDADADTDADADGDGDADSCFGACSAETCCPPPFQGNKHCTDITTDEANCGGCEIACGPLQTCTGGECACFDPAATTCGTDCLDTATDPANCGACGRACGGNTPACRGGVCLSCEAIGLSDCDGACVQVETSDQDCGVCGHACGDGTECIAGECVGGECDVDCAAGTVCCDHAFGGVRGCGDLRTDPFNCGGCGIRCIQGEDCVDGGCGCGPWQTDCDGVCVDLTWDTVNCGRCGHECGAGAPSCYQSECVGCEIWQADECGGVCVYPDFDNSNCGGCGQRCDADQYCNMGSCQDADWK